MTMACLRAPLCLSLVVVAACGDAGGNTDSNSGNTESPTNPSQPTVPTVPTGVTDDGTATDGSASAPTTGGTDSASQSSNPDDTGASSGESTGFKFDVPNMETDTDDPTATDTGPPVDMCKVQDNMDAVGDCEEFAPPDSFSPSLQWSFGANEQSMVTPLAGNFTDDNGDGEIDLCDIPDVLLVSGPTIGYGQICPIHVLDGATGTEHFQIPPSESISCFATPAFGDIDNDGLPEIVAIYNAGGTYRLKAFEHDGTLKWTNVTDGGNADQFYRESGAIAIHDLDADGDAEIVFNHEVYDHNGVLLWEKMNPMPGELEATTAVDLDGDGKLEVVTGHSAYRWDGTQVFENYPTITSQSIPQVGNLDEDPNPEIFITSGQGLWMVEHDGTIKWGPATPTGVMGFGYLTWMRPGTIHDFDGDGKPEYASSSQQFYAVYEGPNAADLLWTAVVQDGSGAAGGTAFDFLGDGVAEAMYADEIAFNIYDGKTGDVLLSQPRVSYTISEYPTVVDVDNDGSAEILIVSLSGQPALQVLRDADDRWIQARRIWNQHAYYVTNVREDSTIPQVPVDNWEVFNTFRTNAQIEGGALCMPPIPM
jgi:hypothetical protein